MKTIRQLASEFVVLTPQQDAVPVSVNADLYNDLNNHYQGFKDHSLVAMHRFEKSWDSWECHPHGDEVVVLLSGGDVDMVLESPTGEVCHRLQQRGDYVLIPRNTWHTARCDSAVELLFITPGEGTLHRSD